MKEETSMETAPSEQLGLMQELANRCPSKVSCLESGRCGDKELCTVQRSAGENILFLENGDLHFGCPYLLPFGYGHLCICPVHARIHKNGLRRAKM